MSPAARATTAMINQFLAGSRVLDLSQFLPGPYAGLILADLGAEVVKIEPPQGDPGRAEGPIDADGVSAWYKLVNRGKAVARLDLKSATGRDIFAALLAGADVLLESFRPGVLDRLGFPRERLQAINPGLVHCALSGWGQTGPYRLRPGHDVNYMALAGGLAASGTAEVPVITNPPVADYASGLFAATMILAALLARPRRGHGAYLDVSLAETVLSWQSLDLTGAMRAGFEPLRGVGPYTGGLACYQVYRTADDRFVTLGIVEDKFWRNFCAAVGRPEWEPRQWEPRPQHALIAELAALFRTRTRAEWEALLDPVETCFHSVIEHAELPSHPQILARRMIVGEDGPNPFREVLLPVWLDSRPPPPRRALREVEAETILAEWGGQRRRAAP